MSRQERVKIERPGVKSVLAFFLLPQFWRSMGHFSYIGPIFKRTLALMLAQSGLLPLNHPATRNGYDADGNKIKVSSIMGEAWFYLRTRENIGMYQWGMFLSIVLMFASMIGSLLLGVAYFMSGSLAQAQLFNHPGPGDSSVVAVNAGANLVDRSAPGTTAGSTQDLAISVLDKVLRQGANSTGGPMQDAIGPMFGTYSTGVLVIASFLIFWSIVSIVIDTARTGQLGGGRHNMVWTPIRFVFALGILVPVGGAFNSGQMIVLKLAEWGSNLGTNMWGTYVAESVDQNLLVGNITTRNPTGAIIEPVMQALVCKKANNIAAEVSLGSAAFPTGGYNPIGEALNPAQAPMAAEYPGTHEQYIRPINNQTSMVRNLTTIPVNFGNESSINLCGSINLPNPTGRDIVYYGPPTHPPAAQYSAPAPVVGNTFDDVADFKQALRQAEWDILNNLMPDLDAWACHMASKAQAADPADYSNTCPNGANLNIAGDQVTFTGGGGCNATPGGYNGDYPDAACYDYFVNTYTAQRDAALVAAQAVLAGYFADGGPFEAESVADGWAGMGVWYYKIAGINRSVAQSSQPETTVQGGRDGIQASAEAYADQAAEDNVDCSGWAWFSCAGSAIYSAGEAVVDGVAAAYNATASAAAAVAGGWESLSASFPISGLPTSIEDGKAVMQWALKQMEIGDGGLLVTIGGYNNATHPMSNLALAGASIMDKAFAIYGAIAFMSLFAGIPFVGGAIEALMAGPVGNFLGMIASFGLMPGLMLLYYVPLIPWVKVMFAVVAWIASVIEAVVTIPIVALAHMRTDGEGLMGPMAQGAYIAWLNLLLRPGLVVIGFVMGNLVFEAMILYMNDTYQQAVSNMGTGGYGIIDQVVNTYLYVFTAYALVNASFKLVDIIPNTTMGWLGGPQSDTFAGEASQTESMTQQSAGELAQGIGQTAGPMASTVGVVAGAGARGTAAGIKRGIQNKRKGGSFRRGFGKGFKDSRS